MKKSLEFASHPQNLSMMRAFVRTFLAPAGFTESETCLMVLGLDEACTNIIRHAYHGDGTRPIFLACELDERGVTFRLRDIGEQCNPSKLRGRPLGKKGKIKPGGLGLHLIQQAFDKVEYHLLQRGTELVLTKLSGPV